MTKPDPLATLSQASAHRRGRDTTAVLVAVHPPGLTLRLRVDDRPVTLGRDALDNRTVSRRHAEITWNGSSHVVRDLDSRNGSRVDGARLDDRGQLVDDGSIIQLGDVFLVYERAPAGIDEGATDRERVFGNSIAVRLLRGEVARAAPDPSPVLLLGETGTGKDWIARELHAASGRSGPLVPINCAALGPQIIESQLFGHVKGSFTGATADHRGLFRAADGGTLFLDEIGELPIDLQPKLLRALQDGKIVPVGGVQPTKVDVRVIAATNRDLAAAIDAGAFRRDLYSRLALWEISVPPLRERRADLLAWLARLHQIWADNRPGVRAAPLDLMPDAVEAILLDPWVDNLRGLDRLVHQLASRSERGAIARADLPAALRESPSTSTKPATPQSTHAVPAATNRAPTAPTATPTPAVRGRRDAPPREELQRLYAELDGNIRALARHYARDRKQIYRWLAAIGIDRGNSEQ